MIFGFNTDVKHGDTIYHVQSEARESEKLLQTQVFVRGRCVGKRAISYANSAAQAGFGDPQKEQQLRDQHRLVLEAIREGKLESVLDRAETEALAGIKQLDVQWENAASVHNDRSLTMQLRVTEGGSAAPGARGPGSGRAGRRADGLHRSGPAIASRRRVRPVMPSLR